MKPRRSDRIVIIQDGDLCVCLPHHLSAAQASFHAECWTDSELWKAFNNLLERLRRANNVALKSALANIGLKVPEEQAAAMCAAIEAREKKVQDAVQRDYDALIARQAALLAEGERLANLTAEEFAAEMKGRRP